MIDLLLVVSDFIKTIGNSFCSLSLLLKTYSTLVKNRFLFEFFLLPIMYKISFFQTIVLILDGNSDTGAHVINNLCYFICLRHLIRSSAVTNRVFFFSEKTYVIHARATCYELISNTEPYFRHSSRISRI